MSKLLKWLKKETILIFPAILYFAICFNLLHYAQSLILQPGDIRFTGYLGATLGAILAAKVILIAQELPFINAFPNKPIIYNIGWKFAIYSIFVLLVQIIDFSIHQFIHTESWTIAYNHLHIELNRSLFWGVQISVLMFFFFYIIFSELTSVIGREKMKKIFFG